MQNKNGHLPNQWPISNYNKCLKHFSTDLLNREGPLLNQAISGLEKIG